jgi:hypothetical protein
VTFLPLRMRTWVMIVNSSIWLTMTWVTLALAQADGDVDSSDGDELSAVALLLGLGALAVVAWIAYRRRSTRPR